MNLNNLSEDSSSISTITVQHREHCRISSNGSLDYNAAASMNITQRESSTSSFDVEDFPVPPPPIPPKSLAVSSNGVNFSLDEAHSLHPSTQANTTQLNHIQNPNQNHSTNSHHHLQQQQNGDGDGYSTLQHPMNGLGLPTLPPPHSAVESPMPASAIASSTSSHQHDGGTFELQYVAAIIHPISHISHTSHPHPRQPRTARPRIRLRNPRNPVRLPIR